jgi:oligopeptide transport system permease protein
LPLILGVIFSQTFALAWVVPGDPFSQPDRQLPAEVGEALKRRYDMHDPGAFAWSYLKRLAQGDLGPTFSDRDRSVNQVLAERLPVSVSVGLAALLLALGLGLTAGAAGAVRPGSGWDAGATVIALVGVSLPSFVTATFLLILLAHALDWVALGDWNWPGWRVWTVGWWRGARDLGRVLLPPAMALSLLPAAYIARLTRMGLSEVLASDFIRTARAKGVGPASVLLRHAMKVAFLPVLSFLGPAAATTLTGSFVVERVFEVPGLGRDFVNAVVTKDQFLILGLVMVYSVMLVLFNLAVDLAYAWVDPRIDPGA